MDNDNHNRIIKPTSDEAKKAQFSAALALAVILGQMWREHQTLDTEDKPVEFAISLRSMVPPDQQNSGWDSKPAEKKAFFRAEAMWTQKVNGAEHTFHAHGPAFGAEDLNKGINITAMFRKIVEGVKARQAEIEQEGLKS